LSILLVSPFIQIVSINQQQQQLVLVLVVVLLLLFPSNDIGKNIRRQGGSDKEQRIKEQQ